MIAIWCGYLGGIITGILLAELHYQCIRRWY
jgi:hypothetical protein